MLRNSTSNLATQALFAVFHVTTLFILARLLTVAGFGEYFRVFALILVVQLLLEAGVGTALTQRIAQEPARWKETSAEGLGLFAWIGGLSLLGFVAVGLGSALWYRNPMDLAIYAAAGVACAAQQVQRFASGVFRAFERFGAENVARVVQGALFMASVLGLYGLQQAGALGEGQTGPAAVILMLAVSHVLVAVMMARALSRHSQGFPTRGCVSVATARHWLSQAVPLGLGDVVRGLTWQLDTVLLGWLSSDAVVVGLYSIAYRPLGPLNWLPRAVSTALFPALARHAVGDPQELSRAFAQSIRLLWVLSLPIAVGTCLAAEPLILVYAGQKYLEAALPLRILIWVACLSFLSFPLGFLFMAVGRPQLYARLVVLVFALEVALELLLIPRWGYFGACAGSVAGELVFTTVGLALCYRLGVNGVEWGRLALAALAAAGMAAVLWPALLQTHLGPGGLGITPRELGFPVVAALGVAGTAFYFVLCVCLAALRPGEVRGLFETMAGFLGTARRD